MKPILFLPLLFFTSNSFSQIRSPEAFISFGGFFEEELDPNAYLGLSVGTELFALKFFAPEIDLTFYSGVRKDEDWTIDNQGEIDFRSYMRWDFDSWVWGFGPKFFIQDDYNRVVLIPKYHFGKQTANGQYWDSDNLKVKQRTNTKFNFWTVSLGYELVHKDKIGKIGIYLTYTGFNAGKSLNQLDFLEQGYGKRNFNTKAIGLTVRLSTGFGKRKTS